jgi:polysaccharide export outer membrane protein
MTIAFPLSPRYACAQKILLLAFAASLAGCVYLPSVGPEKGDIDDQSRQKEARNFQLIDIGSASLVVDAARPVPGFAEHFADSDSAPSSFVAIGDGVTVEIWETGSDTLFAPRGAASGGSAGSSAARSTSLGEQTVGADGCISVPFAGRVSVVGLDQLDIEQKLTQALTGKAARAQVVAHVHNVAGTVTVAGDVAAGARVPLSLQGERLLDVLATAGGVRAPTYETRIQLTRGSDSFSTPMLQLLQNPRDNIYLRPGDLLVATRQPQSFTAFGATGRNAQIAFDSEHLSLIEAVAKTGGLLDARADPRGVYLLRYEPRSVVQALTPAAAATDDEVRVIYRLDLTQANSYFLAQRFAMRDRDIVYVSSAPANQLQKFLELVGLVTQPVIQGAVVRGALR